MEYRLRLARVERGRAYGHSGAHQARAQAAGPARFCGLARRVRALGGGALHGDLARIICAALVSRLILVRELSPKFVELVRALLAAPIASQTPGSRYLAASQ